MTQRRSDPVLRAGRRAFLVGLAAIPAVGVRVYGIAVSDVAFAVALSLALVQASMARATRVEVKCDSARPWRLAALLVAVGGVTSTFFAADPISSLAVTARVLFILTAWRWTAGRVSTSRLHIQQCIDAYVCGAAASAVVATWQTATSASLVHGRAIGLAEHPNDAGGTLAIAFVLAAGSLLHSHGRRRGLMAGAVALIGIGLILSGSVTGMLAATAGFFTLAARGGVRARNAVLAALVVIAVYQVGVSIQGDGRSDPFDRYAEATSDGQQNTLDSRLASMTEAVHSIWSNPIFGVGLDAESGAVLDDGWGNDGQAVHNWFLLSWYQGGLLYVAGVTWLVVVSMRRGRMARSPVTDLLFVAGVSAVVFAMTAPVNFHRYFWLPFVLLAACRLPRVPPSRDGDVGAQAIDGAETEAITARRS